MTIQLTLGGTTFRWDPRTDEAELRAAPPDASGSLAAVSVASGASGDGSLATAPHTIWRGKLLPSFELAQDGREGALYTEPVVTDVVMSDGGQDAFSIHMEYPENGRGTLDVTLEPWGVRFRRLSVEWARPTAIVALRYGAKRLTDLERRGAATLRYDYWPTWKAEGFALPCAYSSPTKSFWHSFAAGDALFALGSFGDSMGSPYAAAYPRPIYAAAMGGSAGYIALGPGSIPDAPCNLLVRSVSACLDYSYREDLWGAPDPLRREWDEPLRIAWADTAFDAYDRLYRSFPAPAPKSPHHQRTFLCTWGDFKEGRYDLREIADRGAANTPAEMIVMDDRWETFTGSGEPHRGRFPGFEEDLAYFRERGFDTAFWQALAWVDRPEEAGLAAEDLLCGADGLPRIWNWSGDPLSVSPHKNNHYCLDPSSPRAREYLAERTRRLVRRYRPAALKLDFGYGIPGPDVCAPRDPALRGERLCAELLRIIGEAAKSVDPDITIIYYGIHPLLHDLYDMINLDDLGDAGEGPEYERLGHSQRCMWAALAAGHGMALNTSTGYYWDTLENILLDTAVVGAGGITLGAVDRLGRRISFAQALRWRALLEWRRRTCGWRPLWLDVELGRMAAEPLIGSWGRIETAADGCEFVAALALRETRVTASAARSNTASAAPASIASPATTSVATSAATSAAVSVEPSTAISAAPTASDASEADSTCRFPQLPYLSYTGDWALIAQDDRDISESDSLACIPFREGATLTLRRPFRRITEYRLQDGKLVAIPVSDDAHLKAGSSADEGFTLSPAPGAPIVGYIVE